MRIEAPNLQIAFEKAASELNCSVTQLDIRILQNPSSGFFGFFKKTAIIEAIKESPKNLKNHDTNSSKKIEKKKEFNVNEEIKHKSDKKKNEKRQSIKEHKKHDFNTSVVLKNNESQADIKKNELRLRDDRSILDTSIIDTFNKNDFCENEVSCVKQEVASLERIEKKEQKPRANIEAVLPDIKAGLDRLFGVSDFKIDEISVKKFDEETVLIELNGEDAALLIGKEGYRYKAISYLLYNWINSRYNLAVRLEIAQFLKNQEIGMEQYLQGIIERVKNNGRAKTKPLDGVLVKIALEKLRANFPDKYVSIKSGNEGQFVVVNDFLKK